MGSYVFFVSNHHKVPDELLPEINGDEPNRYYGYFQNTYDNQFIFVYDYDTRKGSLWVGDADWEEYSVIDGIAKGLVMRQEEIAWLRVCWNTAVDRLGYLDSLKEK